MGGAIPYRPRMMCRSLGLIGAAWTRTRTRPGPAVGIGLVSSRRTSAGSPTVCATSARMVPIQLSEYLLEADFKGSQAEFCFRYGSGAAVTGAGPSGHHTPPGVPGRVGNADMHRGAASVAVHLRPSSGRGGGRVGQDHHTRAECLGDG